MTHKHHFQKFFHQVEILNITMDWAGLFLLLLFSCRHIYIHMMQITFHSTCKISILAGKD